MKKDLSIRRWMKKSVCTGRGLSNSRNMALENAEDDICILCDDDVVYCDRYAELVEEALEKVPDADMMVFNIETISPVQAVRRRSRRRHRLKYPSTCRKTDHKTARCRHHDPFRIGRRRGRTDPGGQSCHRQREQNRHLLVKGRRDQQHTASDLRQYIRQYFIVGRPDEYV